MTPAKGGPKQACDSCHRRKIKCVVGDASTCQGCATTGLPCTRDELPRKRGPKVKKSHVLDEPPNDIRNESLGFGALEELDDVLDPHNVPRLMPSDLVVQCVDYHFVNMYPLRPVVERQYIDEAIRTMHLSEKAFCVVLAFCASAMIHADAEIPCISPEPSELRGTASLFLEMSCFLWRRGRYDLNPDYEAVLVSWFYYQCYLELGDSGAASSRLSDATTLARRLGMDIEGTYQVRPDGASSRRVLYWSLFIAERTHGLQLHRSMMLPATIRAPLLDEVQLDRLSTAGLVHMVALYKNIDSMFIDLWNNTRRTADRLWLHRTQIDLLSVVPEFYTSSSSQAFDVQVAQYWLRVQFLHLCTSRELMGFLNADAISCLCPFRIVQDLEVALAKFPPATFGTHNDSSCRQLYDIACCAISAAAKQRSLQHVSSPDVEACVVRLLVCIESLCGAWSRIARFVRDKIDAALPGALANCPPAPTLSHVSPAYGFDSTRNSN